MAIVSVCLPVCLYVCLYVFYQSRSYPFLDCRSLRLFNPLSAAGAGVSVMQMKRARGLGPQGLLTHSALLPTWTHPSAIPPRPPLAVAARPLAAAEEVLRVDGRGKLRRQLKYSTGRRLFSYCQTPDWLRSERPVNIRTSALKYVTNECETTHFYVGVMCIISSQWLSVILHGEPIEARS